MRSVKSLIAAGAATLMSTAAFAADMAIAPPPPAYAPPPVVEDFGGWYLRGDIGFSNQRVERLDNVLDATLWPLEEQAREAANKRRIGLGFTGLGNTLTMMQLRYDSEPARRLAADIARTMRDAA